MANVSRALPSFVSTFWIPIGLIALGAFPAFAGLERLASFMPGGPSLPDAGRFARHPAGLVVHVLSGLLYTLLGALQFAPTLRRGPAALHRVVGRVVMPAGMVAALSGLWVLLAYPAASNMGPAVHTMRAVAGTSMLALLSAGSVALLRRDFRAHGVWMIRAYALGSAGGTQALLLAPLMLGFGFDGRASITGAMAAGWVVNLVTAEWIVARGSSRHRE